MGGKPGTSRGVGGRVGITYQHLHGNLQPCKVGGRERRRGPGGQHQGSGSPHHFGPVGGGVALAQLLGKGGPFGQHFFRVEEPGFSGGRLRRPVPLGAQRGDGGEAGRLLHRRQQRRVAAHAIAEDVHRASFGGSEKRQHLRREMRQREGFRAHLAPTVAREGEGFHLEIGRQPRGFIAGFIAFYQFIEVIDTVFVLAVRSQREARYQH